MSETIGKYVNHHITPRCVLKHKCKEFVDDKKNISQIEEKYHAQIHKWLFMLTGDIGCEYAWRRMENQNNSEKAEICQINALKQFKDPNQRKIRSVSLRQSWKEQPERMNKGNLDRWQGKDAEKNKQKQSAMMKDVAKTRRSYSGNHNPNAGPQTKITCPHCGLTGGKANLKRYHFDNCKNLKYSQNPQDLSQQSKDVGIDPLL